MLLLLVLACTGTEPAHPPARPFRIGGGKPVISLLDRLDGATLTLSEDNLPADAHPGGVYPLEGNWRVRPGSDGGVWMLTPPVELPPIRSILPPEGWALRDSDEVLIWDTRIVADPRLEGRWSMVDGKILLASRVDPGRRSGQLNLRRLPDAAMEATWNRATSQVAVVEHARKQLSLGSLTHPCLYLPAPSTARFEVELPPGGATMQLQLGLARVDSAHEASAALRLSVQGEQLWNETVQAGQPWRTVETDLARFGGQTVGIELSSDPLGDPSRDYLCVGDPRLVLATATTPDPVRVVLVGIDTLRVDRLGVNGYTRETSPTLDRLAAESVVFSRAWGPAPRTRPSFRTALTGRWPLRALEAATIGEVLSRAGMQTAGIVANVHLAPRLGFADGYQHWSYDDGALAQVQVDRALRWLDDHQQEDAYLFLHLMDPHTFYLAPEPYTDRFTKGTDRGPVPDRYNRWSIREQDLAGQIGPSQRDFIAGRYDGELAYTDAELERLLKGLEELPGRTLLIVHSDHGEELWEHGGFEHNHTLYDELNRVLFWIRPPDGGPGRSVPTPVSLADLAPTIYAALGLEAGGPLDGRSVWDLVTGSAESAAVHAELDRRPLHLGYLMFDHERWAVVGRQGDGALHKYILHTTSGDQELYNLDSDPQETDNLALKADFEAAPWDALLAQATGWPAGSGWRIDLEGTLPPFTVEFDQAPTHAGVIDPEAGLNRRANLEWGEYPAVRPEHVALVSYEDGRLQVQPGPLGSGSLYLLGPTPASTARLRVGEGVRPLTVGRHELGEGALTVRPGSLLVPQEHESVPGGEEPANAEQIEALQVLGYLD